MRATRAFSGKGAGIRLNVKTIVRYDPERITRHAMQSGEKALAKLASFVWTAAHQSIRNKRTSKPGKPMGRGTGFMRDSVVVQQVDNRELHIGFFRGAWVGDLHEWGGRVQKKRFKNGEVVTYIANYPSRPTLRLALEKSERDFERKFPDEFARFFRQGGDFATGADMRPTRMRMSLGLAA